MTHVLIAYGSKRGGTEGLARMIEQACASLDLTADVRNASDDRVIDDYDAVLVIGALYAGRWQHDAGQFVKRNAARLRELPVWFASSGPLGASAANEHIPPTPQVAKLMALVDAQGHRTFGGRLDRDAKGFIARSMAKKFAGDWRDPQQVQEWVSGIAHALRQTMPTR